MSTFSSYNRNWTEWSTIQGVIVRVKLKRRARSARPILNHELDYEHDNFLKCKTRGSIQLLISRIKTIF